MLAYVAWSAPTAVAVVLVLVGVVVLQRRRPWWFIDDEGRPVLPVIAEVTTPRLVIRSPRPADETAVAASIDEHMLRNNGWGTDEVANLRKGIRRRATDLPWQVQLVLEERAGHRVVGGMSAASQPDGAVDLGWWLGPEHRGLGYGTEAVGAVSTWLLRAGVPRVRFGTADTNEAVQRIAAKLGASIVGGVIELLPDGRAVRGRRYELTRPVDGPA